MLLNLCERKGIWSYSGQTILAFDLAIDWDLAEKGDLPQGWTWDVAVARSLKPGCSIIFT